MSKPPPNELAVFRVAFSIESEDLREEYLRQVCGEDGVLYERVSKLLEVNRSDPGFLEPPVLDTACTIDIAPIPEKPGMMIGRYKLIREISHGGMGVVYMAVQQEPVKRNVALKIIKPGMDTREVVARFNAERQALALMDHQSIAHVLDGGSTESGRPYFVMELVDGTPITEYCDECRNTTRQRLELFIQVCHAVQHAHLKGVIHRDIKPSNILVTHYDGAPVPKVIDFGIAKALHQPLTDQSVYTQVSQMVGTPLYMSPEQADRTGQDVDTRTDVYSLGVLLYELLTGTTPFDKERLKNSGLDEIKRIIREEEPPKPSTRLSTLCETDVGLDTLAEKYHTDLRTLTRELSGELDWIVMRAMEKARSRRYESAGDFAKDAQRYLDDELVEARPPSKAYRLGKFCRRNKVGLVAASAVALALFLGLSGTTWQAIVATKAKKQEREQAQIANEQRAVAQANYIRAREAVKQMLTRVADEELAAIPEMTAIRLQLMEDARDFYDELIQLNPRDAQAYFERAELRRSLSDPSRDVEADYLKAIELESDNAEFYKKFSDYLRLNMRDMRRALLHAEKALDLAPDNYDCLRCLTSIYVALGEHDKALAVSNDAISRGPNRAGVYASRSVVFREMRKYPESVADARRAVELDPDSYRAWNILATALRSTGEYEEALVAVNRAIELLGTNRSASYLYKWRGYIHEDLGDYELALKDFTRAAELDPKTSTVVYEVRAKFYQRRGRFQEAIADFSEAIRLDPSNPGLYGLRAAVYTALNIYDQALADYDKALELAPAPNGWYLYKRRGHLHFRLGNYEQALADIAKAVEQKPDDLSNVTWIPPDEVAKCPDESFRKGILELADKVVELNDGAAEAQVKRIHVYCALGREEAYAELEAAIAEQRDLAAEHPEMAAHRHRLAELRSALAHALISRAYPLWLKYGRHHDAVLRLSTAISVLRELAADFPEELHYQMDLAVACKARGKAIQDDWERSMGDLTEAITIARKLMVSSPNTRASNFQDWNPAHLLARALSWRALLLSQQGQIAEAVADCSDALRSDPAYSEAYRVRADAYLRQADYARAAADYAEVRKMESTDAVKDYRWALMYVGAGDLESYRAVCREILQQRAHTESLEEAYWTGWTCALALDATDDWPTVVALAKKAVEADGNSQQYLVTLGAVLHRAQQWEEAIEYLEEADRLLRQMGPQEQTSPAYLWYLLAMAYQKLNRIDDAKRLLSTALEWTDVVLAADLETGSTSLAWNRRLTLELLREEAKRIPVYSELTAAQDTPRDGGPPHPALCHAYLARAEAFAASGKLDEAIADCSAAIRMDPQNEGNYRIRGFAHAWKGEYDLALADFAKLDELGSNNGTEYRRAAALLLSGKQEQYREACADLVREQADSEDASQVCLAARACVLAPAAVNDPDVPVAIAQRAVALKPGVAWQVHTLGMACCRAGQLDEAERTLRESLEVKPDWPARYLNWLGLALVDHQRGDEQKAHKWFTKATDWMHEHRAEDLNITDWMEGELLRREVEKLLETRKEDSQDTKHQEQSEGRD